MSPSDLRGARPAATRGARRGATRGARRGATWMPNQHGAWAMLAGPFLTGVIAAQPRWVHLPLAVLWVVGYLAFFATGLWLKSRRRPRFLPPVLVYTAACVPAGVAVLLLRPDLLRWLPAYVPLLGLGLWLSARRRDRAVASGLATTVAASLMTIVAYDAGGGTDWPRAWALTAVMAVYYAGTVLYVKTMIRERGSRAHVVASVTYHAVVTAAFAFLAWPVAAVFAVLTVRAAVAPRLTLRPAQVGAGEIVLNVLVVASALASV